LARENNALQVMASRSRLGIPVTLSSDPRHHFAQVLGISNDAADFTQWPETLGLAAIGDRELVRQFGDNVRQEYRAVGIHMVLAPQADLATSQRWSRIEGTFGEDPVLARNLVGAFVEGVQGGRTGLGPRSVAAVVKHWVGYGASRDGFDGHNWYGRFSAFPSDALDDHLDAFLDALEFQVAGVMPTYNILESVTLDGEDLEQVGAGFSPQLVDGLLRRRYGFGGFVLSDWSITRDLTESARTGVPEQQPDDIAMPWGVEHLTRVQRFAKAVNAGVDQIGGDDDPQPLLDAIEEGLVTEARVDEAVFRILVDKFRLGLFENPLVDEVAASRDTGTPASWDAAHRAQCRALTWVKRPTSGRATLPLRLYVEGLDADVLRQRGVTVAETPEQAELAIVRVQTPHENLHPGHFFGQRHHEGDLDFKADDPAAQRLLTLCATLPTVLVLHLDRPAILGELVDAADGVLAEFGASDDAVLDVLDGTAEGEGRLPFRLHWSMDDVLAQPCDRPSDTLPGRFPVAFRDEPGAPATGPALS